MSNNFFSLITNQGTTKIAAALESGKMVKLTHFAVGDANGNASFQPTPEMTALVKQVYPANTVEKAQISNISRKKNDPNYVILDLLIDEEAGPFTVREVGIYDEDGDLFAIANHPELAKQPKSTGNHSQLIIQILLYTESAESITLEIDPNTVHASKAYVDEKLQTHLDDADPHTQYALHSHQHSWHDLKDIPVRDNRVINGCMRVWQRGLGAITDFSNPETYPTKHFTGADRYILNGHTQLDATQGRYESQRETYDNKSWIKSICHVPVNGNDYIIRPAVYLFEDKDIQDLISQDINLSFLFRANHSGQYSVAVGYPHDRQFTIFSFEYDKNEEVKKVDFTLKLPSDLFTAVSQDTAKRTDRGLEIYFSYGISDSNPLMSDDSNLNGVFNPVDTQQSLTRRSDFKWWLTSGAWIALTEFKLEKGKTPTEFLYRPFAQELALCQRYFETSYPNDYTTGTPLSQLGRQTYCASGVTSQQHTQVFKVTKRSKPSITLFSPTKGTPGKIDKEFAVSPEHTATAAGISEHSFEVNLHGYSQDTARYSFHFTADSELTQ